MPEHTEGLPLRGVRVVDLTDGPAAASTRLLAELGADVVLIEPPEGLRSRRAHPQHDGNGLAFLTMHANKRGVVLDLTTEGGRMDLLALTDRADIVVESLRPGTLADLGVGPSLLRDRNPVLVVVSISDFGQTGPYRDWRGGEAVQMAMSSVLTRSGAPEREPLLPPGDFATEAGAVQAAFAALLAYYRALDSGAGGYVDCSFHDMAVQGLDPGFGMAGTATMGRPLSELPPGRPDARMLYPIFPCADGHIRLCMLAPKHWRAMFGWLGEPEQFADPSYDQIITRFMSWDTLQPVIADLFSDQRRDQIVRRGSELGIPIASMNTPAETSSSDHVEVRRSFVEAEVAPGLRGRMANGYLEFAGQRAGFRFRAPTLGEHTEHVMAELTSTPSRPTPSPSADRPLSGLRVLDLGVIVVGAESGRLLADQGAEVIKVENRAFMDGARQADTPERVSHPFSVGNRNKLSIGLNLREPRGAELFRDLVAKSDVVLTNFKPGTMESLGFDYDTLRRINPGIVVVDSSAFGNTGPWSKRMGYGPLVRAVVGLTTLWRHPDAPEGFGDDMTVYPDHAAARVAITAVIAALIERRRTGKGAKISVAQIDTVFTQLSTAYLRESLEPGTMVARGNLGSAGEYDAPNGVFPCAGEDAYCVVTVDGDADWITLAKAIGRSDLADRPDLATAPGRVAARAEIDRALQEWTSPLTPLDAASQLQAAGIAAGAAAHVSDLLDDPQLRHRRVFGELPQPGWKEPLVVETGVALFEGIDPPALNPAPSMAQQTRLICRDVLQLNDSEIDRLAEDGILEPAEGATT
ncbi:MAG: acyl-CoA transferase/dehydratase [Mycobacterium sp.]|nr:acyl-CoA transferase/dehydratase [Mycobacterium sp.]